MALSDMSVCIGIGICRWRDDGNLSRIEWQLEIDGLNMKGWPKSTHGGK